MKNKLLNIRFTYLIIAILLYSCEKESSVSLPSIGEVTYEVGYGEVMLKWDFPNNKDVEYISVEFTDDGEDKLYSYSKHTESGAIVPNLEAKEYTFSISSADKNGNKSDSKEITVTPLEPVYEIAAKSLSLKPRIGGVIVEWKNITGKEVQINVEYIDNEGLKKIYTSVSSEVEVEKYILGVSNEEQVFSFYTSNPKNYLQRSETKTAKLKPYSEIKFEDRDRWIIIDYTSYYNEAQTPQKLLDGDKASFWQTNWSDPSSNFPHYIELDLIDERIVTSLGFFNRDHANAKDAPNNFIVEGSIDGINWNKYGDYDDFPTTRGSEILYGLDSAPSIRYIRITFSNPRNGVKVLALAELYIYGAL